MTVSHHQREYPVAEQIPGGDERGIPRRDADGRPADEPLDRHADETGRNGNDRAEHRDDAAERKSASMLRVDEFMAFLHERAEFPALSEQLFHDRLAAPVAKAVNDQTAEQSGSNAQHERQRQRQAALRDEHTDARHDDARRKAGQIHIFTEDHAADQEQSVLMKKFKKCSSCHGASPAFPAVRFVWNIVYRSAQPHARPAERCLQ